MCQKCASGGVYLYLICSFGRAGEPLGPVKIGITGNVTSRLASIQTGCHRRLKILGAFSTPNRDIARSFEGAFHKFYESKRLEGEWFDVDPIEALQLGCESFRHHIERMSPKFTDVTVEQALFNCGVTVMEREARCFRSWRSYYAENSNVTQILDKQTA